MKDIFISFLEELMRRRRRLPSRLATDLGISHACVSRWLSGKDKPSVESCLKLASYASVPLERVLSLARHLPPLPNRAPADWPDFREYAKGKYPDELDDDLVATIESLIERRRERNRLPS